MCLCPLLLGYATAQTPPTTQYKPYAPVALPMGAPKWMEQLENVEQVNYYAMVDSFRMYLEQNPDARRKTPHTKAIVNHFRRWQKSYLPFVLRDGRIRLPEHASFRSFVQDVNKQIELKHRKTQNTIATTNGWEVLSPIMTYDWKTKQASPAQANVQRFGVSRSHPDVLYCGTETGMIFKSIDKGSTWKACSGGDYYLGGEITSVEVSPTNPQKVLVGAGSFLWLTDNGGDSWIDITPTQVKNYSTRVRDAVFHPDNDQQMLVGNDMGVFKTNNNGRSWSQINSGQCFDIKYRTGDPNVIYVLAKKNNAAVFQISRNGGNTFEVCMPQQDFILASGRIGLSAAEQGKDYIYILACKADNGSSNTPPFYSGTPVLYKSTDGGKNWTVHQDIGTRMESVDKTGGQGYYDMVIAASPNDPEQILFGLLQFYRSEDGGSTITNKGGYYGPFDLHCDMQDIQIVGNDTWLSTDGGIIYSKDFFGDHAEARINGIYASELWGFDQGWNEDVMVGGRNHNGNMSQLDRYNGATISMKGSERATGYVFLSNPRKIAYSDSENVVMPDQWTDNFVPFLNFWTYPAESTQYGQGFEFDPRYAKSFLLIQGSWDQEYRTLWKTVDDGESFVALHTFDQPISSHVISRSNPNKIVVATTGNLYSSADGGQTFEAYKNLPEEIKNSYKPRVAVHPRNENEIWLSSGDPGGMFRTKDNGTTWEKMDKNLTLNGTEEKLFVYRFFLTGNEKNAVYAVGNVYRSLGNSYNTTRGRVLYWDETSDGWQDYSEGLPPVITINRMLPFYKEGKIRIATNNGIWQRNLADYRFTPIAQPLILNVGKGDTPGEAELYFDSYSIVNQNGAQWEWSLNPQPLSISDPSVRNPIVKVEADQSYDVTLRVTTTEGTDIKTIKNMIVGTKAVPNGFPGLEVLARDIVLSTNKPNRGQNIELRPQGMHKNCLWQLFDTTGTIVQTQEVDAEQPTQIATDRLTPGIYFFMLTNNEFKKNGKLLILP